MSKLLKKICLLVSLGLLSSIQTLPVYAEWSAPPAPANGGFVLDETGTLSAEEIKQLNQRIEAYKQAGKAEIGILMVAKIEGDYIEHAALTTARTWKIGDSEKRNGALMMIAKDDHKLRIEVGTGLEGELTDAMSKRIINMRIVPQFKKEQYFQGIMSGLEGIAGVLQLDPNLKVDDLKKDEDEDNAFEALLGFLFFIIIISIIRRKIKRMKRGDGPGKHYSSHRSGGSGSSSGSSSSSGSGFSGGGSFSGGGASGSW